MQLTPVPTSIEWYNSEGLLVSKDDDDAVNQASNSNVSIPLTFRRYRERQGGRYECKVAGPGGGHWRSCLCALASPKWIIISEKNVYMLIDLRNPQAVVTEVYTSSQLYECTCI